MRPSSNADKLQEARQLLNYVGARTQNKTTKTKLIKALALVDGAIADEGSHDDGRDDEGDDMPRNKAYASKTFSFCTGKGPRHHFSASQTVPVFGSKVLSPATSAFAVFSASKKQFGGKGGVMGKVGEGGMYNKRAEQAAKAKEKDGVFSSSVASLSFSFPKGNEKAGWTLSAL